MANTHLIGPLVRRFLLEEVGRDRNLSVNTQRSYRDALRLLFHFLAEHYTLEPTQVTVEHLTADVINPTATSIFDMRATAQYVPPTYLVYPQEATYVTSLPDQWGRIYHSHI